MNGMEGMSWARGLITVLVLILLVLRVTALGEYLVSGRRRE
jgi:hypothetical protein